MIAASVAQKETKVCEVEMVEEVQQEQGESKADVAPQVFTGLAGQLVQLASGIQARRV